MVSRGTKQTRAADAAAPGKETRAFDRVVVDREERVPAENGRMVAAVLASGLGGETAAAVAVVAVAGVVRVAAEREEAVTRMTSEAISHGDVVGHISVVVAAADGAVQDTAAAAFVVARDDD